MGVPKQTKAPRNLIRGAFVVPDLCSFGKDVEGFGELAGGFLAVEVLEAGRVFDPGLPGSERLNAVDVL